MLNEHPGWGEKKVIRVLLIESKGKTKRED